MRKTNILGSNCDKSLKIITSECLAPVNYICSCINYIKLEIFHSLQLAL